MKEKVLFEVCCGCFEDAVQAEKGGADRIELNSALFLGGLTPSIGTVQAVKNTLKIPVMCMVRPREGGFCYTDFDYETCCRDMEALLNAGADGIVFGFLKPDGTVDTDRCADFIGKIKKITMRATVVETYDSATIYVPNSEFMSGHLTNWTSNNRTRRMALKIGVAYGSDTNKVIKLLKDCAQKNDGILAFPEPSVVFTDFGNNTLDFTLYYWLKDFSLIQSAASNLRLAINEAFAKEHIEIAFPQLDVHVKDMPPKSVQYHAANPDSQSRRSPLALSRRIRRRTSSLPAPGTPQPRPAAK